MKTLKRILPKMLLVAKRRLVFPKQPRTEKTCPRIICSNQDKIELLSSSNSLLRISIGEKVFYFFECRRHLPIRDYVLSFVTDYYAILTPWKEYATEDKNQILQAISEKHNFNRFVNMGYILNSESPCAVFLSTNDPTVIGLTVNNNDQLVRLKHFVAKYAWSQLNLYFSHAGLRYDDRHTKSANKTLATQAVAKLLNLGDMIPYSEYCCLELPGDIKLYGLRIDNAAGISIMDISRAHRRKMITPLFQRSMCHFQMLDTITHDMDHSPNNYNVVVDCSGMAVGLSVFDNNDIGAYPLKTEISFSTCKNCEPFVNKRGLINRPYADKSLIDRIQSITAKELFSVLAPYLQWCQIWCTWKRILKLRKAIQMTIAQDPGFVLDAAGWSEETIAKELSGMYGKTYLTAYIHDCCNVPE